MPTTHRFHALFEDIARTRNHYETLRIAGGSLDERSRLLDRLHTLRAEIARERGTTLP